MTKIITMTCLRIREDISTFAESGNLPTGLMDGQYRVHDVEKCMNEWPSDIQDAAQLMMYNFKQKNLDTLTQIKDEMRKDYIHLINNMETKRGDFMFPTIMGQYRKDINPVRALYYEIREVTRNFRKENLRQQWMLSIVQNDEFSRQLLNAIQHDVLLLSDFVDKYYVTVTKMSEKIPLELFHARQELKDFRHYYHVFSIAKTWEPKY